LAEQTTIISLGGSIVAPEGVDVRFLSEFRNRLIIWLQEDPARRVVFITGGGAPARVWQQAYRSIVDKPVTDLQDWIGVAATRLNAALVKAIFGELCPDEVVTDPTAPFSWTGRVLVAAGWKPGFSTDFDAVLLAERFGAQTVVNLSNIAQVYTDDPKKNPNARPLTTVSWAEFQKIVGTEWRPGINAPFDPVATKKASELGLTVFVASGSDLDNLDRILRGQDFFGTVIGAGS
jgi:uridylate kinase